MSARSRSNARAALAATTVLTRAAVRIARPERYVDPDTDRGPWSETVAVLRRPRVVRPRMGARALTACALVILLGAVAISAAVPGLNYLHELIEAASAAEIVRSGG